MYSVFVDKRPIRFAFLVNPQDEKLPEQLDAICEYTLDKWRGRFNLIVPTNGEAIDTKWWEFLKKIDPDYVISTTEISDALKDEINAEIHPIDVEVPRPNQQPDLRPSVFTYNDTIRIIPDSNTLPKTSRIPFHYHRHQYSPIFNLAGHLKWKSRDLLFVTSARIPTLSIGTMCWMTSRM
jgi:hypothetical protein